MASSSPAAAPAGAASPAAARAARERYERNTPRKQAREAQRAQLAALEAAILDDEQEWTPPPSPRMPGSDEWNRRVAGPQHALEAARPPPGALSRLRASLAPRRPPAA